MTQAQIRVFIDEIITVIWILQAPPPPIVPGHYSLANTSTLTAI